MKLIKLRLSSNSFSKVLNFGKANTTKPFVKNSTIKTNSQSSKLGKVNTPPSHKILSILTSVKTLKLAVSI